MIDDPNKAADDPAEGSGETIERELKRKAKADDETIEQGRQQLQKQVNEETDLAQKGAP
jgi:F0F1-type ATP synthase membrane subunit b/b'